MKTRLLLAVVALAALAAAVTAPLLSRASDDEGWRVPRLASGHPDLQGVWANNLATPLQRPPQWAGKTRLTDAELEELKQAVSESVDDGSGDAQFADEVVLNALNRVKKATSTDAATGNYNHFWVTEREFEHRTSLIVDPPDGRIPPLTPEAVERQAALAAHRKAHAFDSVQDRPLSERCIYWGVPRFQAAYNSHYQILQTPEYVVFYGEMAHDARIIPLDGRPHLDKSVQTWLGDSRGRWEGDTLVVETTNFGPRSGFQGANVNLRVVERFSRPAEDVLQYEVTLEDPTTWTRPWTVMVPMKRTNELIYEYACHEANYSLPGVLAGARAEEQAQKGR